MLYLYDRSLSAKNLQLGPDWRGRAAPHAAGLHRGPLLIQQIYLRETQCCVSWGNVELVFYPLRNVWNPELWVSAGINNKQGITYLQLERTGKI